MFFVIKFFIFLITEENFGVEDDESFMLLSKLLILLYLFGFVGVLVVDILKIIYLFLKI
jgi:hypothetical protein